MKSRFAGFILFYITLSVLIAACTPTQETTQPVSAELSKPKFSLRMHLEKKDAEGLADSLILSTKGKNDVILLDPVVQLDETMLNKVEFKKDSKETRKLVLYFNKTGAAKLSQLIKSRKKGLVVMMNNEIYETTKLTAEMKNGIFRLMNPIWIKEADQLKETIPSEILVK